MLLNNPASTVAITPDKNVCVNGTGWNQCIEAGTEARMLKCHVRHCAEPRKLTPAYCPDKVWTVKVPAGGSYTAEVESGQSLCMETCGCLLYAYGTEENPLVIPEDTAEIKDSTLDFLNEPGEHNRSLSGVTAFALINCTAEDQNVQLTFKGCAK